MEICIDVDTVCNNKCIFCSKNFIGHFRQWINDFELLKLNILSKIEQEWDIYIWWPEPFNSPILYDLLIYIKKLTNKKIIIKTSWVINDIENFDYNILRYIDRIQVPINSLQRNIFNNICWNTNAFDIYNIFLNKLKNANISTKLVFHVMILKENYKEIPNILLFLHKNFYVKQLVLVYPIKPISNIKKYYDITISRNIITDRYREFIDEGIFKLVNFDKELEYYEKEWFISN